MEVGDDSPSWNHDKGEGCSIQPTGNHYRASGSGFGAATRASFDESPHRTGFCGCSSRQDAAAAEEALLTAEQAFSGLVGEKDFSLRIDKEHALLQAI
jgi:hypothetical protein